MTADGRIERVEERQNQQSERMTAVERSQAEHTKILERQHGRLQALEQFCASNQGRLDKLDGLVQDLRVEQEGMKQFWMGYEAKMEQLADQFEEELGKLINFSIDFKTSLTMQASDVDALKKENLPVVLARLIKSDEMQDKQIGEVRSWITMEERDRSRTLKWIVGLLIAFSGGNFVAGAAAVKWGPEIFSKLLSIF